MPGCTAACIGRWHRPRSRFHETMQHRLVHRKCSRAFFSVRRDSAELNGTIALARARTVNCARKGIAGGKETLCRRAISLALSVPSVVPASLSFGPRDQFIRATILRRTVPTGRVLERAVPALELAHAIRQTFYEPVPLVFQRRIARCTLATGLTSCSC